MRDCIFCSIVNGKLPAYKIYEDPYTCVFLDTAGDVNGHMVAVPNKHVKNILDCDADTLCHLMNTVKLVSDHCVRQCHYDGVNLLNASGESAGQSVPHFHIHIIPRKKDDGIDAWPSFSGSSATIEDMYKLIKIN